MVVTSTGIYLDTDATGDVRPLNWMMFYVLNGPYIVALVLAALWLTARTRKAIDQQLTRSGSQACHPRASPVHSLVTGKALVLRDLVAQGAENPRLVVLHGFLSAACPSAARRGGMSVSDGVLGTRWSGTGLGRGRL